MCHITRTVITAFVLASANTLAENRIKFDNNCIPATPSKCPEDNPDCDVFKLKNVEMIFGPKGAINGKVTFPELDLFNIKGFAERLKKKRSPFGRGTLITVQGYVDTACFGFHASDYTAKLVDKGLVGQVEFCDGSEGHPHSADAVLQNIKVDNVYGQIVVYPEGAKLKSFCVSMPAASKLMLSIEELYEIFFIFVTKVTQAEQDAYGSFIWMQLFKFWSLDGGCSQKLMLESIVNGVLQRMTSDQINQFLDYMPDDNEISIPADGKCDFVPETCESNLPAAAAFKYYESKVYY